MVPPATDNSTFLCRPSLWYCIYMTMEDPLTLWPENFVCQLQETLPGSGSDRTEPEARGQGWREHPGWSQSGSGVCCSTGLSCTEQPGLDQPPPGQPGIQSSGKVVFVDQTVMRRLHCQSLCLLTLRGLSAWTNKGKIKLFSLINLINWKVFRGYIRFFFEKSVKT